MNAPSFAGWDAYNDAVVDIDLGGRTVTLGQEGVLAGSADSLRAPLYVITAYNPGAQASDAENRAAQAMLLDLVAARGLGSFPAVGRSRDHRWQEPSVAVVGLSEAESIEIGRAFAQDAIFGWDGRTLQVIPCEGGEY